MTLTVPYQYGSARLTIEALRTKTTFARLDPEFQRRLVAMFIAANGQVGLGTGWRDPVANDVEVRRRQAIRAAGGHAAPMQISTRTWHCATPAQGADLVGDLRWVATHCDAFRLRTFAAVNGEPWHVACVETPTRRNDGQQFHVPPFPLPSNVTPPVVPEVPHPSAGFPPFDPAHGQWSLWPLATKPTLRVGARGDAVKYLQGVLKLKASQQVTVDGGFGQQTLRAVKNAQAFLRLPITGVVDARTWAVIDMLA